MELLELYKVLNNDSSFVEDYYKNGFKFKGSTYRILNTNSRSFSQFKSNFELMERKEGIARVNWEKQKGGQEKYKQYPRYFTSLGIYETLDKQIYYKTKKGLIQKEIYNKKFTDIQEAFLTLLNLLDSSFDDYDSYLINRTREIKNFLSNYVNDKLIIKTIKNLSTDKNDEKKCIEEDLYWYLTFFDRQDLIVLLTNSSKKHKKKLKKYAINKLESKSLDDVISNKFNKDQYKAYTVFDEILIYYFMSDFIEKSNLNFAEFIDAAMKRLNTIHDLNNDEVRQFINSNSSYFEEIYKNAFDEVRFVKNRIESCQEDREDEKYIDDGDYQEKEGPEDKRVPISIAGRKVYPRSTKVRNKALDNAGHKCEFDGSHVTFKITRKSTIIDYSEAHHIVPMSLQGNFEHNIDVIENIVSLCPTCHRRIHNGDDRELLLKKLFEDRKELLKNKGIDISYDDLSKYYH